MAIDLGDYEKGRPYKGDYDKALAELQLRLSHIQAAHIVHKRRAMVVLEGWDSAGKGGIIKRLTAEWDPRYFEVWPIAAPTPQELSRHFLWRFWVRLPPQGNISVFDRSWYGRVLVERVEGYASKKEWRRGYKEINDFEAQQAQIDTTLVKVFIHVTQKTQDKRFKDRLDHPWKRWKTGAEDYRNRARRDEYLEAMHDMLERTSTKVAPWIVIDGNDKKAARIKALTAIADRLEKQVCMEPPTIDPELLNTAGKAFGKVQIE